MAKNTPRPRTFKARFIPYLVISLLAIFHFYSCGPGNPSEEGGLHGTAAIGKPIKNATITVKSKDGKKASVKTGEDGKYQISAPGKAPFLLKVEFGNTVLYGTAYQFGTANIHPLTDLIIRNWYLLKGTNADTVFDATGIIDPDPPNRPTLDTIQEVLKIYLGALSLIQDWSQFDFITTEFTAYDKDPVGFDLVLSMIEVAIDDNSKTNSPLSIAKSPQLEEDKIKITMFPSPEVREGGTVLLESSATRDFNNPIILEEQQEIEDMLNQLADTVNTKACELTASDLQPYLITDFMWKGWDDGLLARAFKSLVCANDRKIITITPQWTDYDEENDIFTANLFITIILESEEQVQGIAGAKLGKENNNWVWLGDGLPAGIYVFTRVTAEINNGTPQWNDTRNIYVRDFLDQVSEIKASGPSLGDTIVPKICDDFTGSPYYCSGNPKLRIFWYYDNDLDNAIGTYNLILTMEGGATVNVPKSILYIPGKDHNLDSDDFPKFSLGDGDTIHNLLEVCDTTLTASVYTPTWISGLLPPWVDLLNEGGNYLGTVNAQWSETPMLGRYNTFQVYIPCSYDGDSVSNAFLDQYTFNELIEGWGSTRVSWVFCPGGWCGCIDNDEDGYGENCELGPDCDDTNPLIHPNAPESACNGIDDNCDTNIDEGETVYFPDANLESAIRNAISKPTGDIYNSDLCSLTWLDGASRGISNITGIEYCTNLTQLSFESNQIIDISPLSNLTNLTYLVLSSNQITDISPLSNLTSLPQLWLRANQIRDISALSNLTSLSYLVLSSNQITDISPLSNLTGLWYLELYSNQIIDVSPLSLLTGVTDLWLDDNQIIDISALAGLTNLQLLGLGDNQISDISALVANTGLGSGDVVDLWSNLLGSDDCDEIATLQSRGVSVSHDLTCP